MFSLPVPLPPTPGNDPYIQLTLEVGDEAIGLTNSATSGKCNVVYVSIVVTEAQKLELQKCEIFIFL